MRILVFGAGGQVGREVCRAAWPPRYAVLAFDRKAVDITRSAAIGEVLAREAPDLVINLAAYTAVDRAENEPQEAWAVNCAGAAHIAAACGASATPLIQLSTDYVFDGRKAGPYREEDAVDPLGVYGRSKEAGERAVRAALAHHLILRTAWIFGVYGANFVKTMLRLAAERPVLRVVADQRGCPTAAADIAAALVVFAAHIESAEAKWGTYHLAGDVATSWHGFAEAIFDLAAPWLAARPRIEPIATEQYPTPARRPLNSVLDCHKIKEAFDISPPPWRPALEAVIRELLDS
ncbi:MAG TPA: dTDP-4-dehydrorhamnose reductase [Alphaproteobacteria bacterium]